MTEMELKSWEKPLTQVAKADLNRSLIPKLTLGMRINVYSQRNGVCFEVSPISIGSFQAAGLKTTSVGFQSPVSTAAREILLQK